MSAFDSGSTLRLPKRLVRQKSSDVFNGGLRLSGSHFLTDKRTPSESTNYSYFGGAFKYQDKKSDFDWVVDGVFDVSLNEAEEVYYGLPEFFLRLTDDDSQVQVSVGRQKRAWSDFDQRMALGVWQPQLRWDYLNPIQQGLTGAFFDLDVEPLKLTLFASPVFLPDQGPQFRLRDGRFESPNRWFWQPQTKIRFGGESSNLFYELETPKIEEVVMNPSLGGMMQVDPVGPLHVQMAYAYKPMNQFFLGIECSGCVDPVTVDSTARIHPIVVNHHVLSLESSWIQQESRMLFSWTVDRPVEPSIPEDWWAGTELRPVSIPGVSYERDFSIFSKSLKIGLDYFREIRSGEPVGSGELVTNVESSSDRYSFEDLLSVSGKLQLFSGLRRSLTLTTKYAYSFEEKGSWLSSKISYLKDQREVYFGFDVLGSNTDPLSSEAGLFSRYRTNDRVYGGLGFVF